MSNFQEIHHIGKDIHKLKEKNGSLYRKSFESQNEFQAQIRLDKEITKYILIKGKVSQGHIIITNIFTKCIYTLFHKKAATLHHWTQWDRQEQIQ